MLHPLIARRSTETSAFFFSASLSPACLFLDAFRCSLLVLVAVVFTVVSLSVIRCHPSRPFIRSLLLLLPSPGHSVIYFAFLSPLSASSFCCFVVGLSFIHFSLSSPSSACHSFTSASHSQCRLVVVLRVPQESYKSGYRPARYLTSFLLLCSVQRSCDMPIKKISAKNSNMRLQKKPIETTVTNNYADRNKIMFKVRQFFCNYVKKTVRCGNFFLSATVVNRFQEFQ